MESDHGKVSHSAIQDFLLKQGAKRNAAMYLANVLGAHHGRIKYFPNPRGLRPPLIRLINDYKSGIDCIFVRGHDQTSIMSPLPPICADID
jgi:CRISPR-associated endonuclease/helicase Cas3